jgi:hypothetical protein
MRQTDVRKEGWMDGGAYGLTDRYATKIIIAFGNFSKTPKKKPSGQNAAFLNIKASSTQRLYLFERLTCIP